MALERFANTPTPLTPGTAWTTSSALISNVATTLLVTSAAAFPSSAQFRILVNSSAGWEWMLVTAGAGTTTWTVTRAIEGSTAYAHPSGATIRHVVTSAAMLNNPRSMTTLGDVEYLDANLAPARLAAPGNGDYVSRFTGGVPSWLAASALAYVPLWTGAISRTIAGKLSETVSVRDFGAVANGGSNPLSTLFGTLGAAQAVYPHASSLTDEIDWAAAQAAVNALGASGGTVWFDGRFYVFNRPLEVIGQLNVTLAGMGHRTAIRTTTAGLTALIVYRNATGGGIRDLDVVVQNGGSATYGILITATTSTQQILLLNIGAGGDGGGGVCTNGFGIGADTDQDVAFITLMHCHGTQCASAGFRFGNGTSGNVLDSRGFGCTATNNLYGVVFNGGAAQWYGFASAGNTGADFQRLTCCSVPIVIDGGRVESSKRLWEATGSPSYQQPVTIRGVFVHGFTDAAGLVVNHLASTPLTMQDCIFVNGPVPVTMVLGTSDVNNPVAITAINVFTTGTTPFDPHTGATIRTINCWRIDENVEVVPGTLVESYGDVVGSSSSVDNTLVRFDGTTGKLVQGYTSGAPTVSDTGVVTLANTIEIRNSTTAQTFHLYETYTDASNYSRLSINALTSSAIRVRSEAAGTGTARSIHFYGGLSANGTVRIGTGTASATYTSHLLIQDSSYPYLGFFDGVVELSYGIDSGVDEAEFRCRTNHPMVFFTNNLERLRITNAGTISPAEGINFGFGTTTGTKLGTATTHKLAFYGATPIVQGASVADATDAATAITQLNALISRIEATGLIATV